MKAKLRIKEMASLEFNRVMNIDAFVSDYEFMQQLYQVSLVLTDTKKLTKRK